MSIKGGPAPQQIPAGVFCVVDFFVERSVHFCRSALACWGYAPPPRALYRLIIARYSSRTALISEICASKYRRYESITSM